MIGGNPEAIAASLIEGMKNAAEALELLRQRWNTATRSLRSANRDLRATRRARGSRQAQIDGVVRRLDEASEMFTLRSGSLAG